MEGNIVFDDFCTFEYNILYKGSIDGNQLSYKALFALYFPLSLLFITHFISAIVYDFKHKIGVSFFALSMLFVVFVFPNSRLYMHYFTTYLPLIFLSVVYIYGIGLNKVVTTCVVALWFVIPHWEECIFTVRCMAHQRVYPLLGLEKHENIAEEEFHNIIELIPENERDSIASYSNFRGIQLWIEMHKIPVDKYFFNSPSAREISSIAREEIDCYYRTYRPLWIFTEPNENDSLLTSVLEDYDLYYQSPETNRTNYFLWHRK